jgi:hypothetical protein
MLLGKPQPGEFDYRSNQDRNRAAPIARKSRENRRMTAASTQLAMLELLLPL